MEGYTSEELNNMVKDHVSQYGIEGAEQVLKGITCKKLKNNLLNILYIRYKFGRIIK